jgi:5-methylcytosine-specific restriction endonuclease McrA
MDEYIKNLVHVIRNGSMENTYKMAWARSIVEYCCSNNSVDIIHFDDLAPLIFKYYWDQTIYFDLRQGRQIRKSPKIYQIVKNEILSYQSIYGYQPKRYLSVQDRVNIPERRISNVCKTDVCHRFLKVGNKNFDIYKLYKKDLKLRINKPRIIKNYSDLLFDLINHRWTQKLEEFNPAPRISQKVRGTDRDKIKRKKGLSNFKPLLDMENPKHISFISGKKIPDDQLSIDHVIPWSYMYSDDLWNLVYVSKSENSSKSNRLPDESLISKLEKRNKRLLKKALGLSIESNQIAELDLCIANNYVRNYWIGFKG